MANEFKVRKGLIVQESGTITGSLQLLGQTYYYKPLRYQGLGQ